MPEAWRDARADVLSPACRPTATGRPAQPAAGPRRRRGRALALALALVVLAVGGTAGAIALLRHHADRAAGLSTPPSERARAPASQPGSADAHGFAPARNCRSAPPGGPPRSPSTRRRRTPANAIITGLSCPRVTVCYAVDSAGTSCRPPRGPPPAGDAWRVVANDPGQRPASRSPARTARVLPRGGRSAARRDHPEPRQLEQPGLRERAVRHLHRRVLPGGRVLHGRSTAAATRSPTPPRRTHGSPSRVARQRRRAHRRVLHRPRPLHSRRRRRRRSTPTTAVPERPPSRWTRAMPSPPCRARARRSAPRPTPTARARSSPAGTWTVASMGTTARALACPADGFCLATNGSGGAVAYRNGAWSGGDAGSTGSGPSAP